MIRRTLLTTSLLAGLAGLAQAQPPDANWRDHWHRHHRSQEDAAVTPSANNTAVKAGTTGSIVDASGDAWTISNGVVEKNGFPAGYSAHVTQIVYVDGTVWQQNAAGLWWRWDGAFWPGYGTSESPLPAPAASVTAPMAPATTAMSPSTAAAAPQSVPAASPADVPTPSAPVATATSPSVAAGSPQSVPAATARSAGAAPATATPTAPPSASCGNSTTTGFGVLPVQQGGAAQIVDAKGNRFVPRGVNVMGLSMGVPSATTLKAMFPGINFVRLAIYSFNSPQELQPVVNDLTSNGIVVELEDHTSSDGQNRGGGTGTVFTGQLLVTELNWYSSVASAFKSNPYVWFGTNNEPPTTPSAAALSAWQLQTVQAIRKTGNNSPVLVEANCWASSGQPVCNQGFDPSAYAQMSNVVWDAHIYGWLTNYNTDQGTNNAFVAATVAALGSIKSAGGTTMPVHIGEYGNSTTGAAIDPNGTQVINAVHGAVLGGTASGSSAWAWGSGGPGDGLTNGGGLSPYGQQVASYLTQAPPGFSVCSATSSTKSSNTSATAGTIVAQTGGGDGNQSPGTASQSASQGDAIATATASSDQAAADAAAAVAAVMQKVQSIQSQATQFDANTNPGIRAIGQ